MVKARKLGGFRRIVTFPGVYVPNSNGYPFEALNDRHSLFDRV